MPEKRSPSADTYLKEKEGLAFDHLAVSEVTKMPFVTKDLSKAIMKRSILRNNYLQNKTEANRMLYKKQRNYCVSLLRKSKTNYYAN